MPIPPFFIFYTFFLKFIKYFDIVNDLFVDVSYYTYT